jgi:hypothetical protein
MEKAFLISLVLLSTSAAHSKENIIFQSETENSTIGWSIPSEFIAKKIVNSKKSDKENIDAQIFNDGLKRNYRQFFAVKQLNLSDSKDIFLFIRPRSEIYSSFYGAHIFRYWVLNKYNEIIFSDTGDIFKVTSEKYNGMKNIISDSCFRGYCFGTTYIYKKYKYEPFSCLAKSMADEKITKSCNDNLNP